MKVVTRENQSPDHAYIIFDMTKRLNYVLV